MAYMTLPAAHSEADARLAEWIGRRLELEEVHVFWTLPVPRTERGRRPAHPEPEAAGRGAAAGAVLGALVTLGAALGRLARQRR